MNQSRIKLNLFDKVDALVDDLVKLGYDNTHFIDFYVETVTANEMICNRHLVLNNPNMFKDERIKAILLEYII